MVTVRPETTFKETAECLLDHDITGVPVIADDGSLAGIVTEADLMSKEAFGTRYRKPLGAVLDTLRGESKWTAKSTGLTAGARRTGVHRPE